MVCRPRFGSLSTGQITEGGQAAMVCYSHEGEEERWIEFGSLIVLAVKNRFDRNNVNSIHRS